MEKHISKKVFAGICALSGAFILASCDPITAIPTNYNNPIVTKDGNAIDLDDNKLGTIYDSVASDRNSKIVSQILDEVAVKRFGSYKEIQDAKASAEAKAAYVAAHADVFVREGDDAVEGKTAAEVQAHRFDIFVADIEARISEVFYNEITSGAYNDDEGKFDEAKLWMAHYYDFYDVKELPDGASFHKYFVNNSLTKDNAFTNDFLNVVCYSNSEEGKRGYIEEKIFPQILKDKLVEEYVYNTNYSALGRSYARQVNYIKVSYSDSDVLPRRLLREFANRQIQASGTATGVIDFSPIEQAVKGYASIGELEASTNDGIKPLENSSLAYQLLGEISSDLTEDEKWVSVAANDAEHYKLGQVELIPAGQYYANTKLGEIIKSYNKAIAAEKAGRFPTSENKAELDKYLASGKSKEYGLREKLISLAKEDYTTDGWYVKNGGLSELPSALRDRLFNINVANSLDNGSLINETVEDNNLGGYEYDKDGNAVRRLPYLRSIYGNKFVIPAKSQSYAEDNYNYVYQDVEGKALYIVQVLEAPSTPKLNPESATSYAKLLADQPYKTEEIARAVSKVLGTKDSYIKDAYTEILAKYEFSFYESSLYEHFKSEYPDLFDEE